MPCKYHDRIYFGAANLFTLPITTRIILPCCNSPEGSAQMFRREHFIDDGKFSLSKYERLIGRHCQENGCPNYAEGESIISEIVLGEWRKCPGKCISCHNAVQDNTSERPLSAAAMTKYMEEVSAAYREIAAYNAAHGYPAPTLLIGASGDLFFSENYRAILHMDLAAMGIQRISLITSLQTWTMRQLRDINRKTQQLVREIIISVDSVQPALYESIREGSRWSRLIGGMYQCTLAFPGALRKISYTVSKVNFQEVPAVPGRIHSLFPSVSVLEFHAVQDWTGSASARSMLLSEEERKELAAWADAHPEYAGMAVKFLY